MIQKVEMYQAVCDRCGRPCAEISGIVAWATPEFARIAAEFFELDGDITFSMREEKGKSFVNISFRITRVKNFTTLP